MFEIFGHLGALQMLEDFTSTFGDLFYRKENIDRVLKVEKTGLFVDHEIHGIVPLLEGQYVKWRVID